MSIKTIKIHSYEKGFHFRNGELVGLLDVGRHWFLNPVSKDRIYVSKLRDPWIRHKDLDLIVKSGALKDKAEVLDLQDFQRALVWVDGRFEAILSGGIYAIWTTHRKVKVEIVDAREIRFNHRNISVILKSAGAKELLEETTVAEDHVGVYFQNGRYMETLDAGRYVFWKGIERVQIFQVNMAELSLDIAEKVIRQNLSSDKSQKQLIDDFMKDLKVN